MALRRPLSPKAAFERAIEQKQAGKDAVFLAIVPAATGKAAGYASYMRMEPAHGVVEVGNILLSPGLQRTTAATEAMYLMAGHVFDHLGYRRYEWKCNAENEPSRRAALRLGFTFEGIFRQHMVVKGRNRDTAWFSMLDNEWPAQKTRLRSLARPRKLRPRRPAAQSLEQMQRKLPRDLDLESGQWRFEPTHSSAYRQVPCCRYCPPDRATRSWTSPSLIRLATRPRTERGKAPPRLQSGIRNMSSFRSP